MTVTKPQAQMLATLAAACRPNGARRWDTAGTMAAIEKVANRDLAEVILATVRAAADRDVESPGVIPTNGPHWREQLAPGGFVPNNVGRGERCSVCSLSEPACRIRWDKDHKFEPVATALARRMSSEDTAYLVGVVRDDLPATREPTPRKGLEDLADRKPELRAKVDALRDALPKSPPLREPEPTPESEGAEA